MNKVTRTLLTMLIILVVVAIAFYPKIKGYFKAEAANKTAGGKAADAGKGAAKGGPAPVEILVVRTSQTDEKILATGTIIPNEEVEIRSEINGRVTGIKFNEGDYVRKGSVLVTIYDTDLQAQLLKLSYQKRLAEVNEERQKTLLQKEAISQREYDISITTLNSNLADIENLKAQVSRTVIRAPFDGTIGLRYISNGSYLSPAVRIATLTNSNPAKIDFNVPAKYANIVRKGSQIRFMVEGLEKNFKGAVYAVEPKIDPNTRTVLLRAIAPNPNRELVPGAFARVEIVLSSKPAAILVPTEAVIPDVKGHRVFVVRGGKVESVQVEIGTRNERNIEINTGLSVGDTLITSGILLVKPGGEVSIKVVKQ